MAPCVGPMSGPHRSTMERFGGGGMALLPWTKQILTVLWEHLRLLVQVIYYSCLSVFQMFRLEVHLRITDETGQHVQHMTSAANPAESFLFSSLFDTDQSMMLAGSNPLSNFCGGDVCEPFSGSLSSMKAEDLCCGLVDDFVSRATMDGDDPLRLGPHPSWKLGFPGDWNLFVSSTDHCSGAGDMCGKNKENIFDTVEGDGCLNCGTDCDKNTSECDDNEDSQTLWESLSISSDPYNPFSFSACISTCSNMGKSINKDCSSSGPGDARHETPMSGLNFWASRSDSESSWGSSDGSCADLDKEESERLWELFNSPADPYNPMCFTATVASSVPHTDKTTTHPQEAEKATSLTTTCSDTETVDPFSSEDDAEEKLWRSLSENDDPYHPLNFRACLQTTPVTEDPPAFRKGDPLTPQSCPTQAAHTLGKQEYPRTINPRRPCLPKRQQKQHSHPATTVVPWRKPDTKVTKEKDSQSPKKVWFSPLVQVHVMHTWPFARQASRKGPWEDVARDRDRFRRRIQETEQAIGYCFSQSHREKIRAHL
ncbi:hypothetical protein DPEC_G00219900 [Dallia pectoralis]|uniref:Uncharacterized protein n=1 Tax=Dallia pectoralis TaxID=75939 RepID=A0ACC2G3Y0_DALPE|nr:hypothetical protein DPEC_G00219900 [Dallia pectoralis]